MKLTLDQKSGKKLFDRIFQFSFFKLKLCILHKNIINVYDDEMELIFFVKLPENNNFVKVML